jgi:uncharacterized protein (DUF1330 family)
VPAFAVGHLRNVVMGPEVEQYLARIDATLEPFGGRFVVHGARPGVREGSWTGDLIVIGFPDLAQARAWYESPAYQEIIPLRAANSEGEIILVEGVTENHRATDARDVSTANDLATVIKVASRAVGFELRWLGRDVKSWV